MNDEDRKEFELLGNILIILTIDAGGKIEVPRSRFSEIANIMARREYNEETDTDTIEIITNQGKEVLM